MQSMKTFIRYLLLTLSNEKKGNSYFNINHRLIHKYYLKLPQKIYSLYSVTIFRIGRHLRQYYSVFHARIFFNPLDNYIINTE